MYAVLFYRVIIVGCFLVSNFEFESRPLQEVTEIFYREEFVLLVQLASIVAFRVLEKRIRTFERASKEGK